MVAKSKKPGTFGSSPDRTGGRPKGAPNKRTFIVEEIASKYDFDPLDVLFMIAGADWEGLKLGHPDEIKVADRLHAAKEVSKYLYAQKQSVALSTDDQGIRIEVVDYTSLKK